jgi:hypothetical protein
MFRFVCTVTGTPFSNFLAETEYKNLLVGAGYEHDCVQMRDVSDHVFAGLAGFIARKDEELRRFGMTVGKFRAAWAVFGWWARSGVVRGMVITAKKQGL